MGVVVEKGRSFKRTTSGLQLLFQSLLYNGLLGRWVEDGGWRGKKQGVKERLPLHNDRPVHVFRTPSSFPLRTSIHFSPPSSFSPFLTLPSPSSLTLYCFLVWVARHDSWYLRSRVFVFVALTCERCWPLSHQLSAWLWGKLSPSPTNQQHQQWNSHWMFSLASPQTRSFTTSALHNWVVVRLLH